MFPNVSFFHLFLPFLYFPFYCQESCSSFWKTFIYSGTAQMPQKEPPTRDFFNIFGWCPAQKKLCSGCEQIFFYNLLHCSSLFFVRSTPQQHCPLFSLFDIFSIAAKKGKSEQNIQKDCKKKITSMVPNTPNVLTQQLFYLSISLESPD